MLCDVHDGHRMPGTLRNFLLRSRSHVATMYHRCCREGVGGGGRNRGKGYKELAHNLARAWVVQHGIVPLPSTLVPLITLILLLLTNPEKSTREADPFLSR